LTSFPPYFIRHFHYFENASSTEELLVLIVFNSDAVEPHDDIGLMQSISAVPKDVLAACLGVDIGVLKGLPKVDRTSLFPFSFLLSLEMVGRWWADVVLRCRSCRHHQEAKARLNTQDSNSSGLKTTKNDSQDTNADRLSTVEVTNVRTSNAVPQVGRSSTYPSTSSYYCSCSCFRSDLLLASRPPLSVDQTDEKLRSRSCTPTTTTLIMMTGRRCAGSEES